MTNRQKEDRRNETLKNPNENHSTEISRMIDDTIKNKHKVYCATDWHLYRRKEKGKTVCDKRKDFNEIINNLKIIKPDDLLINLGDLVDGEFKDKELLKNIVLPMNFKKILVLGNNDIFDTSFYKSCGFDYVTQSFVWNNVLFSHIPTKNDNQINVHGHIHGSKQYWIPYSNQIDVAYLGGRTKPVELMDVIKAQPNYSKIIKECPEHFEEEYRMYLDTNIFNTTMHGSIIVEDPFND